MIFSNRLEWQHAVLKKFNSLILRKTLDNILFYNNGKLVAVFNVTKNHGLILKGT